MSLRQTAFVLLASLAAVAAHAATIHVPGDVPSIQAAIDVAQSGDEILVAFGTYTASQQTLAGTYASWGTAMFVADTVGTSPVASDVTLRSESGAAFTVLDAQGSGRALFLGGVSGWVVDGFTFTGGSVSGSSHAGWGAGVAAVDSEVDFVECTFSSNTAYLSAGAHVHSSVASFESCLIEDNYASHESAGLTLLLSASATISNCTFDGNSVGPGGSTGGAFCIYGGTSATVTGSTFTDNHAPFAGIAHVSGSIALSSSTFVGNSATGGSAYPASGGCFVFGGTGTVSVSDCRFSGNTAVEEGGAILVDSGQTVTMTGVLFDGNDADLGGALSVDSSNSSTFTSCTFADNTANTGSAIYTRSGAAPLFDRCIVAFNTGDDGVVCGGATDAPVFTCSDIYGNSGGDWTGCIASQLSTPSNFSADPKFCDTNGSQPYRLRGGSPCKAGNHPNGVTTCGLIGSEGVLCVDVAPIDDRTPTMETSWGGIKSIYR